MVLGVGLRSSCHHNRCLGSVEVRTDAEGSCPSAVQDCCVLSCCSLRNAVSIDVPRSCIVCCLTYFGLAAAETGAAESAASRRGSCHTYVDLAEILDEPSWEQLADPGWGSH